uniref:Photolyase/cryptochrome alpha/beta domain-containing protein n=1 Tax=viral metagenome TaxID=1070528 RepID=A0A6C0JGU4_9ZZZZ
MVKITNGLFVFHRDFRIVDNVGLIEASKLCENLYTCFIFTPDQVSKANDYRSHNAIQFMIESLEDLEDDIHVKGGKLLIFYGKQSTILKELVSDLNIDGVYFNKDYTPYAIKRDTETLELCKKLEIDCQMYSDYYLYEPGTIQVGKVNGKEDGVAEQVHAYKKYTPFYDKVHSIAVKTPSLQRVNNLDKTTKSIKNKINLQYAYEQFTKQNDEKLVIGGRVEGIKRLKMAISKQKHYDHDRDYFTYNTTFLSAYIKFGCVSIREVYNVVKREFGASHGIIRELIWREFFAHVLYAYPEVVGQSYQPRYRGIHWHNSQSQFEKWACGRTGFPIVDASMRQMNTTGYMHNRGRMTVSSFLVKVLLIDWRKGEKYFAQLLTDYDIASNNGGWQGSSSTGVDMKPYFRDMNPWIQSNKFDKDAEFIKKWIPELEGVDAKDIHKWSIMCNDPKYKNIDYPKPMVDYDEQKKKMLEMYKDA